MTLDFYDTYATGHDGSTLHFDVIVSAGTLKAIVERVAAHFAGGDSPEVEAELRCRAISTTYRISPRQRNEVQQRGFVVVMKAYRKKRSA